MTDARDPSRERESVSLREYIDLQFEFRDKQLLLQANEYERRLVQLNGEHARLLDERKSTVNRERFESEQFHVDERLKKLEISKSNFDGRLVMLGTIWTIVTTVVSVAIAMLMAKK